MKKSLHILIMAFAVSSYQGSGEDFPSGTKTPNGDIIGRDGTYYHRTPNGSYRSSSGTNYTHTPNGDYIGSDGSHYTRTPNGDYISSSGDYYSRTPNGSYNSSKPQTSAPASSSGYSTYNESSYSRQSQNPCYCRASNGYCSVFRYGETYAYASVVSPYCSRQICESNFYSVIQNQCEELYSL